MQRPAQTAEKPASTTSAQVYSLPLFTDADLASALRAGRLDAQAELVRRYQKRVACVLNRVLGNDPEIADLVQDVFAAALAGAERFRGESDALEPWLIRIAVFQARKAIRRRSTWRRFFTLSDVSPDERTSRDNADMEGKEVVRRVQRVVEQLPETDRILFALRYLEQLSVEEVGDAAGVSKSTIKRRLRKARKRFEQLAQRDPLLRMRLEGGEV